MYYLSFSCLFSVILFNNLSMSLSSNYLFQLSFIHNNIDVLFVSKIILLFAYGNIVIGL